MQIANFNWVDYCIIGLVLISVIISYFRGFFREAISLLVWIVGIIVALKYASAVQIYLQPWISSGTFRYALAFLGLFLVVFFLGLLVNIALHSVIKKIGLSVTDRLLGIFFGAARGLIIVALLLMFATVELHANNKSLNESQLAPKFEPLVSWLKQFLPRQMKAVSAWVSQINPDQVNRVLSNVASETDANPEH